MTAYVRMSDQRSRSVHTVDRKTSLRLRRVGVVSQNDGNSKKRLLSPTEKVRGPLRHRIRILEANCLNNDADATYGFVKCRPFVETDCPRRFRGERGLRRRNERRCGFSCLRSLAAFVQEKQVVAKRNTQSRDELLVARILEEIRACRQSPK